MEKVKSLSNEKLMDLAVSFINKLIALHNKLLKEEEKYEENNNDDNDILEDDDNQNDEEEKQEKKEEELIKNLDEIIQILNTRKLESFHERVLFKMRKMLYQEIDPLQCRCDSHNSVEVVGISPKILGDIDKKRRTKSDERRLCENGLHHVYGRRIMKKYRKFKKLGKTSDTSDSKFDKHLKHTMKEDEKKELSKNVVIYYSKEQAQYFTVKFDEGKIYPTNKDRENFKNENYIFVWDCNNDDFFVAKKKKGKVQHTSFTNGGPVGCAGFLTLKNGHITHVKGHSGHYKPTKLHMLEFKKFLARNIPHPENNVENIIITLYNDEQISGRPYTRAELRQQQKDKEKKDKEKYEKQKRKYLKKHLKKHYHKDGREKKEKEKEKEKDSSSSSSSSSQDEKKDKDRKSVKKDRKSSEKKPTNNLRRLVSQSIRF